MRCSWKEVPLTKEKTAKVDSVDWLWLRGWSWYASQTGKNFYAARAVSVNGKQRVVYMHRAIVQAADEAVDHINGDGLDNRRSNLRLVTHQQNAQNQSPQEGRSSRFRGVYWSAKKKFWVVQIKCKGHMRTVSGIDDEVIAARIYDLLAIDRFGEYARLNFPQCRACGEVVP